MARPSHERRPRSTFFFGGSFVFQPKCLHEVIKLCEIYVYTFTANGHRLHCPSLASHCFLASAWVLAVLVLDLYVLRATAATRVARLQRHDGITF